MIGPERAFELSLIELLTFYWPTDLSACPAMRAGRDDREEGNEDSETTAAVLVVECVGVERQPGNSGALLGEADVFVQADVADLSQAQVDVLTGALSAAVQAVEEGLSVAVAAGRDYPAFILETYGQVEVMKHGPEAENPAGGRMRRDGVKVMLGFGLVVGDGGAVISALAVNGEYLTIDGVGGGSVEARLVYVDAVSSPGVRLAVHGTYLYVVHSAGTHRLRLLGLA